MPFVFNQQPNSSKTVNSAVYPIQVIGDSGNINRVGPLVTAEELKTNYLFGIPLTSPLTKQTLTVPTITGFINRALNEAEVITGINIVETVLAWRGPYDKALVDYSQFVELPKRPVTAVNLWSIQDSSANLLYIVPAQLVEMGNAILGQLSIGFSTIPSASPILADGFYGNNAAILIRNMAAYSFPSFWYIEYVVGYPLDKIPSIINQLISVIAAIDILSMMSPILRPNTSSSLGIDGLSQSTSSPGPQWLLARVGQLEEKKEALTQQIKSLYYNTFIVSNF